MTNTLIFAGQTITDDHIFGGINYLADLNPGEEFTIGNTASASVSFVTDIRLPLYTKDPENGTFIWTQTVDGNLVDSLGDVLLTDTGDGFAVEAGRGRFYITEVTKSGGLYTVTAYDGMMLLETSIAALGITSFPATAASLASAIEAYSGYTITGTLNNGSLTCIELDDTMTIRALLSYIAEISGANVKLTASGELRFMYYEDSGIELTASDYKSIEVADYECSAIDCVKIVSSSGEAVATAGTGDNTLFIAGNPFADEATAANAEAIFDVVGGFTYSPLTSELFNEEGLEIGVGATFGGIYTLIMSIDASTENGVTVASVGNDSRAEFNKSLDLKVMEAMTIAKEAQELVEEVNEYFWTSQTDTGLGAGAHVTQKPMSQAIADPANAGSNVLIDSNGLDIRKGATSVANFGSSARIGASTSSHVEIGSSNGMNVFDENNKLRMNASSTGISVFDFDENDNRVNVAQFATTARIGEADKQYVRIGSNAFSILRELSNSWLIAFMGYGTVNGQSGTGNAPYYILGQRNANLSTTYGENSLSESRGTATGYCSHAEGTGEASGHYSHAENNGKAKGDSSHAGGQLCEAKGVCSTATGQFTSAKGECQVAIGKYNAEDTTSALIIGNGTSVITRSNAMSVDFNGNMTLAGGITVKGHNSAIGTILDRYLDRNLSVAHNTGTALCGVELPVGVWLLQAWVRFPSNATGMRACNISNTSGAADWQMSTSAVSGGVTQLHLTRVINVTSLDIYYLNVVQTSGSAMTLATGAANGINSLRAVRIA